MSNLTSLCEAPRTVTTQVGGWGCMWHTVTTGGWVGLHVVDWVMSCRVESFPLKHQLSLALADLALQSNWLTAVMDTIQTFHDSLPKVLVMLDVLKYLPEEVIVRA